MRAYLGVCVLGVFAYDEKGKPIAHKLFKKDPREIARKLEDSGKWLLPEEKALISDLSKKGYKEIAWSKDLKVKGTETVQVRENPGQEALNRDFRKLALDLKFVKSQAELNQLLTRVQVARTKTKLKEVSRDRILMRVVGIIDELDKELNNLSERLREWYGLYFPEAEKLVRSNEKFTEIVKQGKREDIQDPEVSGLAPTSAGMAFTEDDLKAASLFAGNLEALFRARESLSDYLEAISRETIPNTSRIAGSVLACRLLAIAGGLDKLAKLPASTIQLLGAEKALFRHMREKTRAPKYGVLFAHPYVQKAPKDKKGKIARLIAAKLSLAARVDFFSKEDRGKKMKADLDEQVKRVLG